MNRDDTFTHQTAAVALAALTTMHRNACELRDRERLRDVRGKARSYIETLNEYLTRRGGTAPAALRLDREAFVYLAESIDQLLAEGAN